jgi:hypothetical protein
MYFKILLLLLLSLISSYGLEHVSIKASNLIIKEYMTSERNPAKYLTTEDGAWKVNPATLTDRKQISDATIATTNYIGISHFFRWAFLFSQVLLCFVFAFFIKKLKTNEARAKPTA